jgi:hypothetical protein
MPELFEPVGETLLRAGVAPTHVRRYLRELSEHLCDLVAEALDAGASLGDARVTARARLGADEALVNAMLAEPSMRSWTGRAPWATLVVGPVLLLVLAWAVPLVGLVLLLGPEPDANGLPLPLAWLDLAESAMLNLVQVAGPLVIGCNVALIGARQRSPMIWPLLGCVVVAFFGAGVHWTENGPWFGSRGQLNWGLGMGFHWGQSLAMGSLNLAVAGAAYWMGLGRRLATA